MEQTTKIIRANALELDFETIGVLKIIDYPLEKRDYKPYAQARLALTEASLSLELLSFEAKPSPKSCLTLALAPSKKFLAEPFVVSIFAEKSLKRSRDFEGEIRCHFFEGDDLQGVFWGARLEIPLEELEGYFGEAIESKIFMGIYKTCQEKPFVHYGSLFPTDWSVKNYIPTGMREAEIINF